MSMILKLKFKQELIYSKTLGYLLGKKITDVWYKDRRLPDVIIPVPLHAERLKQRGFNQALEIGRYLTPALAIPMDYRSVVRKKPTLAQSGLSREARRRNIQGAFTCQTRFEGLTLAILDDVMTTGQTVAELSHVLQQQGARHIDIWCCARA
jgi:ComF family protein